MPPRGRARTRQPASTQQKPLHRTRQLASKILTDITRGDVSQTELEVVKSEIQRWIDKADDDEGITPGIWSAVDAGDLPALHALYAVALRRSCAALAPEVSDSARSAWAELRSVLSSELGELRHDIGKHVTAGYVRSVAHAVLRAQALRCHAALLAAAAKQLECKQEGPGHKLAPRRSRRSMQAAADALAEGRWLLELFDAVLDVDGPAQDVATTAAKSDLLRALYDELQASALLEHWARLLLLLAACDGWVDEAAVQLHAMAAQLLGIDHSFNVQQERGLPDLLLVSPSLSYLLSSHVVGLCAALDGGPTYGMPAAADDEWVEGEGEEGSSGEGGAASLRAAAPVFSASGLRLRRHGAPEGAGTQLARLALSLWTEALKATPSEVGAGTAVMPPLNTAAAFELSMRLADAAMEAMACGASAQGRSGGAATRVAAVEASELVEWALLCGRQALGEAVLAAAELSPRYAARLRRFWAALMRFIDATEAGGGPMDNAAFTMLAKLVPVSAPMGQSGLPPRPSPCVAVALDSGYLLRFNCMLRRCGFDANGLSFILNLCLSPGLAWGQLLAFGPPDETAAVVRTLAEQLRRAVESRGQLKAAASQLLPIDGYIIGAMQAASLIGGSTVAVWCNDELGLAEVARSPEGEGGGQPMASGSRPGSGASADEEAAAGAPRLWIMVSYMAVHLLPHVQAGLPFMCQTICQSLLPPEVATGPLADQLRWVRLLAAALQHSRSHADNAEAAAAGEAAGAPVATEAVVAADGAVVGGPSVAAGAAGAGSVARAGAAEEWAALLVPQLAAVLGHALALVIAPGGCDSICKSLRSALEDLLLMAPRELGLALASADTQAVLTSAVAVSTAPRLRSLTVRHAVAMLAVQLDMEPGDDLLVGLEELLAAPAGDAAAAEQVRARYLERRGGDDGGAAGRVAAAARMVRPSVLARVLG